ncbi:fimbrial protein [Enterobacter asburiae]|uniref:fimbrial protein n=1 Tax=Enterobacter asburiae TaxID=61645 RepID=UPI00155AE162|nr:fimbrial protein [Enterobacter asburiae]
MIYHINELLVMIQCNKIQFISWLVMIFCGLSQAHDGTVNIAGVIQDNTCEIASDSQNFVVDMGVMAQKQFRKVGDSSPDKSFSINLEHCGPAASEATVTFSGVADSLNSDLFAIDVSSDSVNGLALGIYDGNGKPVPPGKTSTGVALKPEQAEAVLDFSARYTAVKDSVTAGSTNVTVTFVINYE